MSYDRRSAICCLNCWIFLQMGRLLFRKCGKCTHRNCTAALAEMGAECVSDGGWCHKERCYMKHEKMGGWKNNNILSVGLSKDIYYYFARDALSWLNALHCIVICRNVERSQNQSGKEKEWRMELKFSSAYFLYSRFATAAALELEEWRALELTRTWSRYYNAG